MSNAFQAIFALLTRRQQWLAMAGVLLLVLIAALWLWRAQSDAAGAKAKKGGTVEVVSALVAQGDVAVRLTANGTASARQTVEVRPQISATIKTVHIKEGRFVHQGDLLFTLDTRTEAANHSKAQAQLAKSRADLSNAERNLERQRELFQQKYISQAAYDTAQNQVDGLRGQLAVDQAAVDTSRVALSFGAITAPIAGRTGAIAVYPGSLVQPNGPALLSITQIDPINVSFAMPERELASLQQALGKGEVPVTALLDAANQKVRKGRLAFIDNAVDTTSGTIRLKAEFHNADNQLWPGMFVTVALSPQTLKNAITVPVQAVQTGPEKKFIYVIGEENKVASVSVDVQLIQDGIAVIEGIKAGTRIVVEGGQNLRPGSVVTEAGVSGSEAGKSSEGGKKSRKKPDQMGAQPGSPSGEKPGKAELK
jgi:RND family efflux transporter MFP subunit